MTKSATSQFSELAELQSLEFQRVEIDKALFSELGKMTNVKIISFSLCKFDAQAFRNFDRIRSRVARFNPVSFLGVQGTPNARQPGSFSCEIERVVGGSGAEKAGIQPGDVIQAVDGSEIKSFAELRMFISQFEIGEKMKLRILRGKEKLDLTVTLGTNPNRQLR